MLPERIEELEEKERRLREWLEKEGFEGVAFRTIGGFAWATAGGEGWVRLSVNPSPYVAVLMGDGRKFVFAPNIERGRVMEEELSGLGFEPVEFDWFEVRDDESLSRLVFGTLGNVKLASDWPLPGAEERGRDLKRLRFKFTPQEVERMREVCKLASEAICESARGIRPGMTEFEIAGKMAEEALSRGLVPTVLLVAVDERIRRYRHPIPTKARLVHSAMLVLCARKGGLIAAVTRFVHFGRMDEDTRQRHTSVQRILARMIVATKPGRKACDIFSVAQRAYAEEGFEGEWRNHHQGGAIGYEEREYVATPALEERVLSPQAFAWNPSVPGAKAEETILVLPDGSFEVLTICDDWPVRRVEVEGREVAVSDVLVVD